MGGETYRCAVVALDAILCIVVGLVSHVADKCRCSCAAMNALSDKLQMSESQAKSQVEVKSSEGARGTKSQRCSVEVDRAKSEQELVCSVAVDVFVARAVPRKRKWQGRTDPCSASMETRTANRDAKVSRF
jgi:hypothetical protein